MSKVVEYQRGAWSVLELSDGKLIMVSIAPTSVWIYVRRRWHFVHRRWLPRIPRLLSGLAFRLGSANTLLAATDLEPLRSPDGQTLEAGIELLENLTRGLERCTDVSEAQEFVSQVESEVRGLQRCARCGQTRKLSYFALDSSKPSGHLDVCVACDNPETWRSVQKLKEELESLPPDQREQRFIERGKELGLVKELAADRGFPAEYRGVKLDEGEREVIADFLETSLGGSISPDARTHIEHLYVADALCFYAGVILKQAHEKGSPDLARAACQSAEKAMKVARDEPFFIYQFAGCLEAVGFDADATEHYRLFLERTAINPGSRSLSPVHMEGFRSAVETAKRRLSVKL